MATLEEALLGLNVSPADTGYGIATQTLGRMTPQLINPYGSTGQAVGISLGSILLQSLLGYQARSQAAQDTLQANTLANQMMSMTTPQARTEFIGGVSDPMQQSRLSTLATALTAQEQARKAKAADTLLGLETAAEFELGPKGTELFERKTQGEMLRQAAITGAFKERQELEDAFLRGRALQRKQLGLEDVNVPAALNTQIAQQTATTNLATDIAEQVDAYTSTPAFVASRGLSAFGDDQLKQRLNSLASLIVLSRTGKASNETERANLESMIKGDWSAVSPTVVSGLLKRFAADERIFAAETLEAATQRPEVLAAELRRAATEGGKTQFTTRVPSYGVPAAATVETPTVAAATQPKAQDKQSRLNDILNQIKQTTDPVRIAELKRQATAVMQGQ